MRSFGFTLILLLLAALACGTAVWQWMGGSFETVLGVPPTPVGERLYTSFQPQDVKFIRVSQSGVIAEFELTKEGWQCTMPWKDRMDPRVAVGIINFTLSMRVENFDEREKVDPVKAGFDDNGVDIRLEGENRTPLVRYKLGKPNPWLATVKDMEKPVPTVMILPRDANRKDHVYVCTGDINANFRDGLRYLRDHHPFYFNPLSLQRIRIRTDEGQLTLARENPNAPWRIVLPMELATNPEAIKSLLEGLFDLYAVKVYDRSEVPPPTSGPLAKTGLIGLTSFGSETETLMEIFPPDPAEARDVKATVSDRPNTVFDLPLKPEPNTITLANLPRTINELRDPKLTNLNIAQIKGILIQPATGAEILISKAPSRPWMVTVLGQSEEANEERLFTLLKTATEGKAIEFVSDAATDFTPWGLDKPILKLRFTGQDAVGGIELAFGTDGKGGYFVNRTGSPAVMRVEQSLVDSIPRRPHEWRQARVWSLDRLNLLAISRKKDAEPPLHLLYNFTSEEWTASGGERDLTPSLVPSRANYLLGVLEGVKATRWLSPDDESAATALQTPSLIFKVLENDVDDMGDIIGRKARDLYLAPGSSGPNPLFYYGRLGGDAQPFLMDKETYQNLATDLLE